MSCHKLWSIWVLWKTQTAPSMALNNFRHHTLTTAIPFLFQKAYIEIGKGIEEDAVEVYEILKLHFVGFFGSTPTRLYTSFCHSYDNYKKLFRFDMASQGEKFFVEFIRLRYYCMLMFCSGVSVKIHVFDNSMGVTLPPHSN